jgi:hypothetical protein
VNFMQTIRRNYANFLHVDEVNRGR